MILGNKILAPYVRTYFSNKGVPKNVYIRTMVLMWSALIISGTFSTSNNYVRVFLLLMGTSVTIHLTYKLKKNKN